MKGLKESVIKIAERDAHIEYSLPATECLLEHMLQSDWEDLESLVQAYGSLELFPADFHVLVYWVHQGPPGLPLPERISALTPSKRAEEGKQIAKQLRHLSVKIQANFPELSKEYSLLRILFPWKHAEEPFTIKGSQDDSETDMKEDCNYVETPYTPQEILFELKGSRSNIENVLRRRKAYGLEAPVVGGKQSVISELQEYILRSSEKIAYEPSSKGKYPTWCMVAAHDLWRTINHSYLFRHASTEMKKRIMEYTIYAYADYHELDPPGEGWGPEQFRSVIYQP